jgi:phage terminase large subunit-like protein
MMTPEQSLRDSFLLRPIQERQAILAALSEDQLASLKQAWWWVSRPSQLIPEGDWTYWLIKAGRGFGKTRTGAETVREWISQGHRYVNLIGATADDARDIMVQGESGILAICPDDERPEYRPSQRKLIWPNGAESLIFTADEPERLRGKQHSKLWADELAAWRYAEAWDQAKFGLRLGDNPQAVITTTPRPTKIVREIMADPATVVTNGSTYDNRANLAPSFFTAVLKKYEGTRLGRQEIEGAVLDDNPGALFKRSDIDKARVLRAPDMQRVVVAIDPAATSAEGSDDTGMVTAGIAMVGDVMHGYILHDLTCHETPMGWAKVAVKAYRELKADRIIGEANNGGDMIEAVIRSVDENVSYRKVTATRGKAIRAEPVAALYEQGRIHHVGDLGRLEDEMCEWDPMDKSALSPNRLDAMVWAITDLMLADSTTGILDFYRNESKKA